RATVEQGDPVRSGQAVGYLLAGHPGCPAPACLHWGARLASGGPTGGDDDYVDPLDLLGAHSRPIALKPLRPGAPAAGWRNPHARGWAPRYAVRSRSAETCV